MNVADFSSLITIIGCTAIAAGSAWHGKAGWFTIIFLIGGFLLGLAIGILVQKLAYYLLHTSSGQSRSWHGWVLLLAYMIIPFAVAVCGIVGTGMLTEFLTLYFVKH